MLKSKNYLLGKCHITQATYGEFKNLMYWLVNDGSFFKNYSIYVYNIDINKNN